ncbi:MAG TPA: hypothetical protein VKT32_17385 [Chthonomonadaceae bacterium]|nr:hypothetical protein [Chthonomonadaceae bacterium]
MFGKASKRRLSAATLFDLFAVAATLGLVAALQYGASARALQPSICSNVIDSVAASPNSINPGQSSTITVTLDSVAPSGGCSVNMSYSSTTPLVNPPSSLNIAGGSSSGSYQVTAQSNNNPGGDVTITATDNSNSQQTTLKVAASP